MSTQQAPVVQYTVKAAQDFRTLINLVATYGGTISAAGAHAAMGIALTRANSGQHMAVGMVGIMKAVAGAIVTTPGFPLTTAASGFVIAATSGGTVVGRYLPPTGAACASGDMITGFFNFSARPLGGGSGYL